jgi:CO dehydrogenase nickel-insertion accessory protein CooC1
MSNAINLWAGEKGGTGKSFVARLDCQRHLDRNQDFFLIDTDKSNATTSNYYGSHKFDKKRSLVKRLQELVRQILCSMRLCFVLL